VLSVIIPTLNSKDNLETILKSLSRSDSVDEIIVADGGSNDQTKDITETYNAQFIRAPHGRGSQLSTGALASIGDWLLFIHADSRLLPGWSSIVQKHMDNAHHQYRAAYFRFALETTNPQARYIEKIANWRAKSFGLPYGDQGLLISRRFYEHIGGFNDLPIMEDVDMVRRIGKNRLDDLPLALLTGADRYDHDGYIVRPIFNLFCLSLYFLGVQPDTIKRLYE